MTAESVSDVFQNESIHEGFLYSTSIMDKENKTKDWILINSPFPVLITLGLYLAVLKLGPSYMEARAPFELNMVLRVYNILQVIANAFFFVPIVSHYSMFHYIIGVSCGIPMEADQAVDELKDIYLVFFWGYLVLKMVDLLDTVFMILRKQNSRITFLHVYHHMGMVFFVWVTIKYIKAHQAVLPGLINVFVHMVMYSYYFLATFGSRVQRYLWWKQHLTKLQLMQFAVIILYIFLLYYYNCPISKLFTYIWVFNIFVIFCLFLNFYIKAYVTKPDSTMNERKSK